MSKSQINKTASPGLLGTIGVGAVAGAFTGVGALVAYGLVVTKSSAALVAAKTALVAGIGGVAASLVMRRDRKRMEKALEQAEDE